MGGAREEYRGSREAKAQRASEEDSKVRAGPSSHFLAHSHDQRPPAPATLVPARLLGKGEHHLALVRRQGAC